MADNASHDQNHIPTLLGVSSSDGTSPVKIYADPSTHRLLVNLTGLGSGTVTSVAVTGNNGITKTVTNPTTTPSITLGLGDITPNSITIQGLSGQTIVWANSNGTPVNAITPVGYLYVTLTGVGNCFIPVYQ